MVSIEYDEKNITSKFWSTAMQSSLFVCLSVSVYIFRIANRENVFHKRSFFVLSIKKLERSTKDGFVISF